MGESPAKPGMRRDVKIGIGIVVAVVLAVLIGQCGGNDRTGADDSAAASGSSAPARPMAPAQAQVTFNPAGVGVATARFTLEDGASTSNIRSRAQRDTVEILAYIDRKYPQAGRAIIEGTFTTTDKYGNSEPNTVLNLYYEKATLDKINYAGVDPDKIWSLRDAGFVLPDLANG